MFIDIFSNQMYSNPIETLVRGLISLPWFEIVPWKIILIIWISYNPNLWLKYHIWKVFTRSFKKIQALVDFRNPFLLPTSTINEVVSILSWSGRKDHMSESYTRFLQQKLFCISFLFFLFELSNFTTKFVFDKWDTSKW